MTPPKQPPPEYPPLPAPEIDAGPRYLNLAYNDITANCARLAENNQGRVVGEIEFTRIAADGTESIIRVKTGMDFHSDTYRDRIIRTMSRRVNTVDWETLTEDVCHRAISHCRAGEPEFKINSKTLTIREVPYLLFPFLPANQPTFFFGKKGSGKSILTLQMAISVSSGWHDNPWFKGVTTDKTNTLWLDWETDKDSFEYDLKRLAEGNGRDTDNIIYQHCTGNLVNQIEIIKAKVNLHNIKLVIIDSVAPAVSGEIKDAAAAVQFHNALRYLGITSLSIAHPTKADTASVTGAGQFEDLARNVWEVVYSPDEDLPTGHQALIHRKPFKTGFLKPIGFKYEYADIPPAILLFNENPNVAAIAIDKMSDQTKILELLKLGDKSSKEIGEIIGKKGTYLYVTLNKMCKAKKIIKLPTGKYGLVEYRFPKENE